MAQFGQFQRSGGPLVRLTPQGWVSETGENLSLPPGTGGFQSGGGDIPLSALLQGQDMGGQIPMGQVMEFDRRQPVDYMGRKGFMQLDRSVVDAEGRLLMEPTSARERRIANEDRTLNLRKTKAEIAAKEAETEARGAGEWHIDSASGMAINKRSGEIKPLSGGMAENPRAVQAASAQSLGVPLAPEQFQGFSQKTREQLRSKEYLQAEKRLAEEEAAARAGQVLAGDAKRFQELNQRTETGPVLGSAPVAWARGVISPDVQEMQAISDRLTPQMRQPGAGSTSDFDARMFRSATIGVSKDRTVNDAIAQGMQAKAQQDSDRAAFANAYLQANNTLRGADTAWKQYVDANPIFDPESPQVPKLNTGRRSWSEFFSGAKQASGGSFNDPEKERRYQEWKARQGR